MAHWQADEAWETIDSGVSAVSGAYIVEERADDDDDNNRHGTPHIPPVIHVPPARAPCTCTFSSTDSRRTHTLVPMARGSSGGDCIFRRLIFLQNQNFVQTEVRMAPAKKPTGGSSNSGSGSGSGSCKGKKDKKKGKPAGKAGAGGGDGEGWVFDFTYLDDHHRALLAGLAALAPDLVARARKVGAHRLSHCVAGGVFSPALCGVWPATW